MKKILALLLCMAMLFSLTVIPASTAFAAEELVSEGEAAAFSDAIMVLSEDLNPRAIRTKVLSDGTVAAIYYRSGSGIWYAESKDGGASFSDAVKLVSNATDSTLAASDETTAQVTIAKEYVSKYGANGRGRLEAQNPNIVELENGNIMAFYRYNTYTSEPQSKPWGIYYASICYQVLDRDTGAWSDVAVMVDTDREKALDSEESDYGFWEPDPVYITDENGNKSLFVYYADTATPNNLACQNIMYCVYDGNSFSAPAVAQDGTAHSSRDGMSVVTELSDGSYAMVFESTKTNKDSEEDYITFVIKMSFSKDGRSWTEPIIVAKPQKSITDPSINGNGEYAVCASP